MDEHALRLELVDTARAYFLKYGYSRVSTAEIADRSGRSKKTLYKHFPTKERLLAAVLERVNANIESEILALLGDRQQPFAEIARQILERVGVHIASIQDVLLSDLEAKEPGLYQHIHDQQFATLGGLLEQLLQTGIACQAFRGDVDLSATVRTFLLAVEGLARATPPDALAEQATKPFATLVAWVIADLRLAAAKGADPSPSADS